MSFFLSPIFLWVLLGACLFGMASASVGSFAYLRKRSLVGDALAHAALPGITIAYALTESRRSEVLLLGAACTCLLAYLFIEWVSHSSKLKQDSILAITLSFFFAIGIFHLSQLQASSSASQAGLDKMIFGQAAAITKQDMYPLLALSVFIAALLWSLYHRLLAVSFDRSFASGLGWDLRKYELVLLLLTVAAIVLGLQLVGVVLMAALLITPPATARFWTNETPTFILLSAACGAFAGVIGTSISALYPKMPTGPWIVLVASVLFLVSALFGTSRGLFWSSLAKWRFGKLESAEDVIRSLFLLEERVGGVGIHNDQILRYRPFTRKQLAKIIQELEAKKLLLTKEDGNLILTPEGREMGERLTRRHRLFEVYLTEKAHFPPDIVHEYAERAEHVFTKALEQEVEAEVKETARDPHGKEIPK